VAEDLVQWVVRGEAAIPAGEAWLREPERQRLAHLRFTKRRSEYLVRRLAGKVAVATVLGLGDDAATLGRIGVLNKPTGAPYVTVDDQPAGLEVSLTDRAGWAVCVVGRSGRELGVDLEIVEARSPGFVTDFLAPDERSTVAAWSDASPGAGDLAANLIWSAKESALKVLHVGLGVDTRTVEVRLSPLRRPTPSTPASGWAPLSVTVESATMPGYWRRDGLFVLTVVTAPGTALRPPRPLPGSAALLAAATPVDGWMADPVAD
jgi:4'-phosphopantetheinyl transferase